MRKRMKKMGIAIVTAIIAAGGLMGCGTDPKTPAAGTDVAQADAAANATDETEQQTTQEEKETEESDGELKEENDEEASKENDIKATAGPEASGGQTTASEGGSGIAIPEISMETLELPESEALSFVHDMKIGWNLGNTFDASTDTNREDEMSYETLWCGVPTTKEMIDTLKEAGFNTVRIPVSWHNHVSADGSYTISDAWMNRVQEVVDYAIDNNMYVIINIHHDNSTSYMYPSYEYLEQSKAYVKAIWTQVAERFADYDGHLLMESLNEPRLVDTEHEWWLDMSSQDCVDAVQCINELNQVFVDTVRSSGGNNADRYLLVPGYDASLQGATNQYFTLPNDIEGNENKILVEVHAYTPYAFALQAPSESGSTDQWSLDSSSSTSEIDNLMDSLYNKYTKNGIGVVIDEFAARDKGNNTQARVDFATYYIAAARARGITCCWWDNNAFTGDGENMGLLRRRVGSFLYPELVEGLMKYCD